MACESFAKTQKEKMKKNEKKEAWVHVHCAPHLVDCTRPSSSTRTNEKLIGTCASPLVTHIS